MSGDQRPFAANTIHFGFRPTTIDMAAVAASWRGVAAILIGTDRHELDRRLAEALQGSANVEYKYPTSEILDAVAPYLKDRTSKTEFHSDVPRNAPELTVYAALRTFPICEASSYGAAAKAVGTGLTAQKVGATCAANLQAVVVPCHRVLKAHGSISGNHWGVHHKRKLLAMEKAA